MAKRKRAFKLPDIFRHKLLSSLTVNPAGTMAAFTATQPDLKANEVANDVWAWGKGRGTWQVTFGGKASQPRFSPRGDRLAFLSQRAGGKPQVTVMEGAFSEGRQVTSFEEGVVKFEWSPDGRRLAVVAKADRTPDEKKKDQEKRDWWTVDRDERRRGLWVVNPAGNGKPRKVSADGEHVSSMAWTPDGKRLVYTACPVASIDSQWFESDLKVVSAAGKGRRTVRPVHTHLVESRMSVAADGRRLLLCEAYDEVDLFHDVAKVVDLMSGEVQLVAPKADVRNVAPQWLPDGRVLLECGVGTGFSLQICEVGGSPEPLPTHPSVAAQAAVAADAGLIFYIGSDTGEPDEVFALPLDGAREPRKLTSVNRSLGTLALAKAEAVRWNSDGMAMEGILYLPSKAGARKPYPLIAMPHGGPYSASITSYGGAVVPNIFCAAGYACFLPNFRGSTHYGRAFTRKIVRNWGDGPFSDMMAGIDSLVRRRIVDGKRLAIFSGSYGGYMTAWAVGHTNRFRCAVAVAAVINNLSMWGTTDIPTFQLYSSGRAPADFTDKYWRDQSPLYHVGKVKTPTFVITGEVDVRVPPSQSHEFYRALKARGVETQLLLYPREPHGVSEPRHRVHYFETIRDWIDRHMRR